MTSKPLKVGVTWASQAPISNILDPDSVVGGKVDTGWIVEIPPLQFFNWIQNNISARCAYINELGISGWDADTVYPLGAWVNVPSASKIFESTVSNNQGIDPASGSGDWEDITILGGEDIGREPATPAQLASHSARKCSGGLMGITHDASARAVRMRQSPSPLCRLDAFACRIVPQVILR